MNSKVSTGLHTHLDYFTKVTKSKSSTVPSGLNASSSCR